MMRVVSSTRHQLLKYPTPSGMANLIGDQAMARTIATVAQKKLGWVQKTSRVGPNQGLSHGQEVEEDC